MMSIFLELGIPANEGEKRFIIYSAQLSNSIQNQDNEGPVIDNEFFQFEELLEAPLSISHSIFEIKQVIVKILNQHLGDEKAKRFTAESILIREKTANRLTKCFKNNETLGCLNLGGERKELAIQVEI
jgi:hypothetical protein